MQHTLESISTSFMVNIFFSMMNIKKSYQSGAGEGEQGRMEERSNFPLGCWDSFYLKPINIHLFVPSIEFLGW